LVAVVVLFDGIYGKVSGGIEENNEKPVRTARASTEI
jgi:hypothetical protein